MGQSQTILTDLKKAMKEKQADKVSVLRMLVAAINNAQIEKKGELTDGEVVKILNKEAKKRTEAIEMYEKAERAELVEKETKELEILKAYLPETMDKGQLEKLVKELKEAGELGEDFGANMRAVLAKTKGQADGKLVSEVVREL